MFHKKMDLKKKHADGYIISLGSVNLAFLYTDIGMIGYGAFDVKTLDRLNYPAVKIALKEDKKIEAIDDLFLGTVKEVNCTGLKLGIKIGMSSTDALEKL